MADVPAVCPLKSGLVGGSTTDALARSVGGGGRGRSQMPRLETVSSSRVLHLQSLILLLDQTSLQRSKCYV